MPDYTNISQEQNPGRNLLKAAAGIGLSFVAFAAFEGPLRGVSKAISQRAGLLMRSFSPEFRTAWSSAATAIKSTEAARATGRAVAEDLGPVGKFFSTFGNARFQGELRAAGTKELPGPMRVMNHWMQTRFPTWGRVYQSAVGELANFEKTHAPNSKWFKKAIRTGAADRSVLGESYRLQYAKAMFTEPGAEKRVAGAAIKWFGAYAATAPAFYLADRATGLFIKDKTRPEKKRATWNIPGKTWDFLKWSAEFAPADILFRGGGKVFGLAKDAGLRASNRFFSTSDGQKIASELLSGLNKGKQFTQNVIRGASQVLKGAQSTYLDTLSQPRRKSTFFDNILSSTEARGKAIVQAAARARSEFKVLRAGGVARPKTASDRFIDTIVGAAEAIEGLSHGTARLSRKQATLAQKRESTGLIVRDTFNLRSKNRATFVEKMLALRPKIMRRSDLNAFIDAASGVSQTAKLFDLKTSKSLFEGRESFRMSGLYEQGDVAWLNKKYLIQRGAEALTKVSMHIPFMGTVSPFSFLGSHFAMQPTFYFGVGRQKIPLTDLEQQNLPNATVDQLFNRYAVRGKSKASRHEFLRDFSTKVIEDVRAIDPEALASRGARRLALREAKIDKLKQLNILQEAFDLGGAATRDAIGNRVAPYYLSGGAGDATLAVGGNLFFIDRAGDYMRLSGYKAHPVQNRFVNLIGHMLYPKGLEEMKTPDVVANERNYSPWQRLQDKIFRKLEFGPYANKEQAEQFYAAQTAFRNLTERTSYRNIFGASFEQLTTEQSKFARKEFLHLLGIGENLFAGGMPAHISGLVPVVDSERAINIIERKYGAKAAQNKVGSTIMDGFTLSDIARDPHKAAQAIMEMAKHDSSIAKTMPDIIRKFAQDVLTNPRTASIRESSVATRGQLLRSAALTTRLEQMGEPIERALTGAIPEPLEGFLGLAALRREFNSILGGADFNRVRSQAETKIKEVLSNPTQLRLLHGVESRRPLFDLLSANSVAGEFYGAGGAGPSFAPLLITPERYKPSIGGLFAPASGEITAGSVGIRFAAERAAGFFGVRTDTSTNSAKIFSKILTHRVLPAAGAVLAWRVGDAFTDENPLFAGTMLDEGLNVAAAEQVAKAHLLSSRILDATGITALSKYTEGLLPGSVNSPLFRAARTIGLPVAGYMLGGRAGGLPGAKRGMITGLVADAALGFGLTDLTKTHEELVEEYSGRAEVPVRRNRFWEFGKGPFAGGQIEYFRPNWFARIKGQHMNTPDMYGSKWESALFQPLPFIDIAPGSFAAPHYYARKHYLSRPYPETAAPGSEAAIIGPTLGKALSFLGDVSSMHTAELENTMYSDSYGSGRAGGGGTGMGGVGFGGTGGGIASAGDLNQVIGKQFYYGITEPMGIFGWASSLAAGGQTTALSSPFELATSATMTSQARKFWNLNLGGGFLMTEPIRRLMPRKLAEIKDINPLRNTQADWLPEKFKQGDPFVSVNEGELRLPGTGYEAIHSVSHTFPGRGSMIGYESQKQVAAMLGIEPPMTEEGEEITSAGTAIHRAVQADLMRKNLTIAVEQNIYDPYHDVSGTIDLVLRKGREQVLGEIKTKSLEGLQKLAGPQQAHMSQLNFYLHTTNTRKGYLIYAARENPNMRKVFEVTYSAQRYQRDMERLEQSRLAAGQLLDTIPTTHGASYSHVDRLRILGDLAPTSDEYYKELAIATTQSKRGQLDEEGQAKYDTALKQRQSALRVGEMYPTRFMGRVMSPAATYDLMSENKNIKAASEYNILERTVGAGWEMLQGVNNPVSAKFFNYPTPSEAYRRAVIYDNIHQNWGTPYESFVSPYAKSMLSSTNPVSGAIKGTMAGFLMGGPFGAMMGAAGGAATGATMGTVQATTGWSYLPSDVKKNRSLQRTMDQVSYAKNMHDYQLTGNPESLEAASNTLVAFNTGKSSSISNYLRAVNTRERPYVASFINVTDPLERKKILGLIPQPVGEGLQRVWNQQEGAPYMSHSGEEDMAAAQHLMANRTEWEGFDPNTSMRDIKVSMIKNQGLDMHDFGMGYASSQRVHSNLFGSSNLNISDPQNLLDSGPLTTLDRTTDLRRAMEEVLRSRGAKAVVVTVTNLPGSSQNSLTVNCSQDRTQDLIEILREPSV